jgi:hypothetical protein
MLIWRNKFIEKGANAPIQLYPAKQQECQNGYHKTLETLFLLYKNANWKIGVETYSGQELFLYCSKVQTVGVQAIIHE